MHSAENSFWGDRDGGTENDEGTASGELVVISRCYTNATVPVTWNVCIAPAADDRMCPIVMQQCYEVEQQAWLASFINQGNGDRKERRKRGSEAFRRLKAQSETCAVAILVCCSHRLC
jgi:hypothetical protein